MQTQSSNSKNDSLTAILKQAEILQTQLQMDALFKKNIDFFRGASNNIHKMFKEYTPKEQRLILDPNGDINLVNIQSKQCVYNKNPKLFAKEQVDNFIKFPKRLSVKYKGMTKINDNHVYAKIYNKTISILSKKTKNKAVNPSFPIGLVTIVGVGLGHHLEELIKRLSVKHIFIYENNKDSFYASLFTFDWVEFSKKTQDKGQLLNICIGESSNIGLNRMGPLASEIGAYNMVYNYLFSHTMNQENKEFYIEYSQKFPLIISSLGYFDDELISFSHTIHNMNNNLPIFKPVEKKSLPPAFLIGNGPSLKGELIDFIKKHQDDAIIISSGSAISSLYNLGIVPDLHVEIERNLSVAEFNMMSADLSYTRKIPLLTLNTTIPSIDDLFNGTYIAIKANDLGATVLEKYLDKKDFFPLELCNPTATNGTCAYAINLGFRTLYLFGFDYGMADKDEHHSKHSIYSKIEDEIENSGHTKTLKGDFSYNEDQFPVKGNLSEVVSTSALLDISRSNIEALLHKHPNINCINPNNGAFIKGATPVQASNLIFDKSAVSKNKNEVIKDLLKDNFTQFGFEKITEDNIKKDLLNKTENIINTLRIPTNVSNIKELNQTFDTTFKKLSFFKKSNPTTFRIISGSIVTQLCLMTHFLYKSDNKEALQENYSEAGKIYNEMLDIFIVRLEGDNLEIDDTGLFDINDG